MSSSSTSASSSGEATSSSGSSSASASSSSSGSTQPDAGCQEPDTSGWNCPGGVFYADAWAGQDDGGGAYCPPQARFRDLIAATTAAAAGFGVGTIPPACVVTVGSDGGLMSFAEPSFNLPRSITLSTLECMQATDAGEPACLAAEAEYGIFFTRVASGATGMTLLGEDSLSGFSVTVDAGTVASPSGARLVASDGPDNAVAALTLTALPSLPNATYGLLCEGAGSQLAADQVVITDVTDGVYLDLCSGSFRNLTINQVGSIAILLYTGADAGLDFDHLTIDSALAVGIRIQGSSDQAISLTNADITGSGNAGMLIYGTANFSAYSGVRIVSSDGPQQIGILPLAVFTDGGTHIDSEIHLGDQATCGSAVNTVINYNAGGGVLVDPRVTDGGTRVLAGNTVWQFGGTAEDFDGLVTVTTAVNLDGGLMLVRSDGGRVPAACAPDGGFVAAE